MRKEDLRSFDMKRLNEMRQIMKDMYGGKGPNCSFWDELESILQTRTESYEWAPKPKDDKVWRQRIGEFYYKHTVHRFVYLYAEYNEDQEVVIAKHGHKVIFHEGKQIKKVKEWYIFPDGAIEFCDKDAIHQLVNNYGKPIYVISVKVMSNATH